MTEKHSTVLVAKCLAGYPCRYHGCAVPPRQRLLSRLAERHEIALFCPEEASGLPTPRPASRWRDGKLMADGQDVTPFFQRGAELALNLARRLGAVKFYGLRWSPSCDPQTGVTAQALSKHGIKCHFG